MPPVTDAITVERARPQDTPGIRALLRSVAVAPDLKGRVAYRIGLDHAVQR